MLAVITCLSSAYDFVQTETDSQEDDLVLWHNIQEHENEAVADGDPTIYEMLNETLPSYLNDNQSFEICESRTTCDGLYMYDYPAGFYSPLVYESFHTDLYMWGDSNIYSDNYNEWLNSEYGLQDYECSTTYLTTALCSDLELNIGNFMLSPPSNLKNLLPTYEVGYTTEAHENWNNGSYVHGK